MTLTEVMYNYPYILELGAKHLH